MLEEDGKDWKVGISEARMMRALGWWVLVYRRICDC